LSNGLGHKAEYLQLRRFVPCAILPTLVIAMAGVALITPAFLVSFLIGFLWIIAWPLCYYLTYHKASSDFGFHLDTVFGMYIIGWLMALKILIVYFGVATAPLLVLVSLAEFLLILLPVLELLYYRLYGTAIDVSGMSMVLQTYTNEVIEFYKSLPALLQLGVPVISVGAFAIIFYSNFIFTLSAPLSLQGLSVIAAIAAFLTVYLWNTRKGVFIRTGLVELFLDVRSYIQQNLAYKTNMEQRIAALNVEVDTDDAPHTHILVIGESASRDYMGAFGYVKDTTPWLSALSRTDNCVLFTHAYSCAGATVPSLERALTEINQYNDLRFVEACSFVDIARKAGYKISWFSNQSHIGAADTPITLIANTADVAEWTKLHLNQAQYDGTLLDYVKTVDPQEKNFIVIHLKGSHFNFITRYPHDFARFSEAGKYDLIPNYLDSIAYTDHVLGSVFEYAQKHLNLQSMIYFSDHACIPDKRRSPKFSGFAGLRIPCMTWLSDAYIRAHRVVYEALLSNKEKYWTNDLGYELICGVLDVKSNHYDSKNSLASKNYRWQREELLTDLGRRRINDDNEN
jgi:heptose-I-phosphate ethanolaminephosphotransferase